MEAKIILKRSEKDIQRSILKYLKVKGYTAWRNNSVGVFDAKRKTFRLNPYTLAGGPDIFILLDLRTIALEVKSSTGVQSDVQRIFQANWESPEARREYYVVRSLDDVMKLGL